MNPQVSTCENIDNDNTDTPVYTPKISKLTTENNTSDHILNITETIAEDKTEDNKPINTTRTHSDNFSQKQRSYLYQENLQYHKNKGESPRCPCCQRLLSLTNLVAGHIKSYKNGGINNIENGLIICTHCNNSDTRDIPTMVDEEWGNEHPNKIYLMDMLKSLGKTIP